MSIVVQASVTVEIPSVPNFLRLVESEQAGGEVSTSTIDVADITDDALRRLGELWTQALIDNAGKRRVE